VEKTPTIEKKFANELPKIRRSHEGGHHVVLDVENFTEEN